MKTSNFLRWNPSKTYTEDGVTYRIDLNVSLDDDCHNMHCDFSITCMIYEIKKNGKREEYMGGCCHEEIVKHFPELEKFIPLHLCGHAGEPMYPVENGIYHIIHSSPSDAMRYLRITEAEFLELSKYLEEKLCFKYKLYELGIVSRWKKEADEFIEFLECKTGKKWANPYNPEEERFRLTLTDESRDLVRKMISEGYYTEETINERRARELRDKLDKQRQGVFSDYNHKIIKLNAERDTLVHIINCGVTLDNVIYYSHSDTVKFNWKSYEKKVTKEDFDRIEGSRDGNVPDFVKFEYVD